MSPLQHRILNSKRSNFEVIKQGPPILLVLPRVQLEFKYEDVYTLQHAEHMPFSKVTLAWAFQQHFSYEAIGHYIQSYPPQSVCQSINSSVIGESESLPGVQKASLLFYAVERNCARSVRLLLELGADPNAVLYPFEVPALAFAIIHAENDRCNTMSVVTTLLSFGASSFSIPKDMWKDYLNAPQAETTVISLNDLDDEAAWCDVDFRATLARTFNLNQRYFLAKAAMLKMTTVRMKQLAKAHKVTALLEVPYLLVGQLPATTMVLSKVIGHLALCAKNPLVLLFAGPSGHGKTELAKQMGKLMSVDSCVVDCTEMRVETDLFGKLSP